MKPSGDLLVRPMTIIDVEEVMAIERDSDSAPHWSRSEYLKLFECDRESNFKRFGMVIQAGAELAGFTILRILITEDIAEAELELIVIASAWRKQGFGLYLLLESIRLARNHGALAVLLEVRASNTAAIELYRKANFRGTALRRRYYRDPEEDAVLMSVTL